jgi:hypothetical protein
MHEINRPYVPTEATADFLYQNYLLLRTAPQSISKWARQLALESIASCEESWRVIGISELALREIATAGDRTNQQRGHWYPRETRYNALFGEKSKVLERDAFIKFFFEHDTTVIVTKEQNNKNGDHSTWGRIIPVEAGLFPRRGYIPGVRKGTEVPWARARVKELDAVMA